MKRESEFTMPSQKVERNTKCGNCKYHRRGDDWVCTCDTSSYYSLEIDYNHACIEFEPRAQKRF